MTENEVVKKLEQTEENVKNLIREKNDLKEENAALKKRIEELENKDNIEGPSIIQEFDGMNLRMFIPIDVLNFSEKTQSALEAAKIRNVGDILKRSGKILKIRNVGMTSANEIYEKIKELGLADDFTIK